MFCLLQITQLQDEVEDLRLGNAALVSVLNDVGRQSGAKDLAHEELKVCIYHSDHWD